MWRQTIIKGGSVNSTYLEVGIGLAVVFFVVASVADGFNEILSRALNTRAKALWAALTGLLSDGSEEKPDLGLGFIFKSILPSWLGGIDLRPRVPGDALSALDRATLIEWIVTGKDQVDQTERQAAEDAFQKASEQSGLRANAQFRSRENKVRWWLEKATDEQLLQIAKDIVVEYGDVTILYPPLQEATVRQRLQPQYLVGVDDRRAAVAEWIARLPLEEKAEYLAANLPIDDEVLRVLSAGNDYEASRLAGLDSDKDRYHDHDPGLGRTDDLLQTSRGDHLATGYIDVNRPDTPDIDALAEWLFQMPIKSQIEIMQGATYTGEYLTAAGRTASLLASASVSGLDYVRSRGMRTKVWWVDGRTFGSALWEMAKERTPAVIESGGFGSDPDTKLDIDTAEGVRHLAAEWRGTPLGDYLASTGIDRARSVDQFVSASGAWFDSQMDRLALTYRRNVKWVLGFFGFFMAAFFNLNAIGLTSALINDAEARATLNAYSESILANTCNSEAGAAGSEACVNGANKVESQLDEIRSLDNLGVPLLSDDWEPWRGWPSLIDLLGMSVTAVAVSFGGVFWYDFLKFLTGVRRKT